MNKLLKYLKMVVVFVLIVSSTYLMAEVIVVSDIDDTIRATNVLNRSEMIINALRGFKSFPRLIDIYCDINDYYRKKGEDVTFYYLSAAPRKLSVDSWLESNNAPKGIVQQRRNRDIFGSPEDYKFGYLKKFLLDKKRIADENNDELEVIMFGDNGEKDPIVYKRIMEDKDIKINNMKAYIRKVTSAGAFFPKINYFYSEKDLLEDFALVVDPQLKIQIESEYAQGTLVPEYVVEANGLRQ
ncbi:MAG: hypothetical protein HQK51_04475 [Oligoflexia bacterium]|nr:hypothetical protein [Oligoflexia bacterium]